MELTKTVAIKKKWLCKLTMLKKLLQKNNKRGTVLIIIFSLMLFTNCKSELQSFNDTVLEFANNDKRIDKNEFEILLEVISTSDERGFAQFKNENGTIENTRIVSYLLKYCSAKNIDLTESDITVLKTVDDQNAAVLISDFVFSPGKNVNAQDYLNNQGVGIKIDFAEKIKKFDLSAVIIQLESNFEGTYYDKTNKPIPFKGKRPYYIWIFGSNRQISKILDKKILDNIKGGYLNRLVLQSEKEESQPNYKILSSPKIGDFSRTELNNKIIADASLSKNNQNKGFFGFNLAVDFSNSIQDPSYFLDTTNYVLSNASYQLVVEPISNKNDPSLSGFTHLVKLKTTDLRNETLEIQVVGKTPNWVYNSSSIDDSNILNETSEQQKTFGLQYLIEGVSDAFYPKSSSNAISTFTVTIKK